MPEGYFVDGKLTYKPLVSVTTEFAPTVPLNAATKTLAVVGEFPFLKGNVPYVFLSQDAFLTAAPGESSLRELASMIYSPSAVAPFSGSPAAVILVNSSKPTQASAVLRDRIGTNNVIKFYPKTWGRQGNFTALKIAGGGDPSLDQFTVTVAARGLTEEFPVDKGLNTLTVKYTGIVPSNAPPDVAYGFDGSGSTGAGAGSNPGTLSVQKLWNNNNLLFTFSRTLTQGVLKDSSSKPSWRPDAPVTGNLTFTKPDGSQVLTGDLVVHVIGTGENGLPLEQTLTFTNSEVTNAPPVTKSTTTSYASVSYVSIVGAGWTGNLGVSGNGPTVGAEAGQEYVSEAIAYLNSINGFSAATDSFRASSTEVADLDETVLLDTDQNPDAWVASKLLVPATSSASPVSFSASRALLLEAFSSYASLVSAEQVLSGEVPVKRALGLDADVTIPFDGGAEAPADGESWASAFSALRNQPASVLVPYTTSDALHRLAFEHTKFMWGKGQREMQLVISPPNDTPLNTLISLRRGYADFRVTVLPHKVRVRKWNGGTSEFQTKYLGLIFAAMQCANAEVGLPMGGSRPNVLAFSGHSTIMGPDAADALLGSGFTPLEDLGNGITIPRWVTTFGESNDPCRTEGSAVESIAFSNIGVRNSLRPLLNRKATPDMLGNIRGTVTQELTRQIGLIVRGWDPASLQVTESATSYTVKYTVYPHLPVNRIAVTSVALTFPIA